MKSATRRQALPIGHDEPLARSLIDLLAQGAPVDDFNRLLADADAMPASMPGRAAALETVRAAMAVHNRLAFQQERERGMLAVIESAQDLSSRLDLREALAAIVSRARHLLGSDVAWLSTHDPVLDRFQVQVAEGALSPAVSGMATPRDRGVVGVVLSTRLPFTTPDYLHDRRFAHDPALDDAFREEGIGALVGVPLVWGGDVIGLLFVADRYHRMHSAHAVAILCTLATHGAVALRNALDFERMTQALERADEARAELERHLRSIQAATDAHEQLTSLLARGASLGSLCQAVAAMLGGGLLVLDEAGQAVGRGETAGYRSAVLHGWQPYGDRSAEVAQAVRRSRLSGRSEVAFIAGDESCRVMPVIGGDDVLGSALLFHRGALEDVDVRTFERSSSVIGIVLLSQQRLEASRHRSASTLLRALVWPRQDDPALLADRAASLGLDLAQPLALLLVEVGGAGAGHAARRLRATTPPAQALVDEIDGLLVVLAPVGPARELRHAVAAWVRHDAAAGICGVLSRTVPGVTAVPALYATLRRALAVAGRLGIRGRVLDQDELALYSALFETHDDTSLATFLDASIGPLLAHDRQRSAGLAPTLLAYFDCLQNARATARRLGLHVNTVRQRLATIEQLLGPWADAPRALEIQMALRLWRLRLPD